MTVFAEWPRRIGTAIGLDRFCWDWLTPACRLFAEQPTFLMQLGAAFLIALVLLVAALALHKLYQLVLWNPWAARLRRKRDAAFVDWREAQRREAGRSAGPGPGPSSRSRSGSGKNR